MLPQRGVVSRRVGSTFVRAAAKVSTQRRPGVISCRRLQWAGQGIPVSYGAVCQPAVWVHPMGVGEGLQGSYADLAAPTKENLRLICCSPAVGRGPGKVSLQGQPAQVGSSVTVGSKFAVQGLFGGQQAGVDLLRICRNGFLFSCSRGSSSCTAAPTGYQPQQCVHPASMEAVLCKCTPGFSPHAPVGSGSCTAAPPYHNQAGTGLLPHRILSVNAVHADPSPEGAGHQCSGGSACVRV